MTRSEYGDSGKPIIPQQRITEGRINGIIRFLCDKIAAVSEIEIKITEKLTTNDDGKNPKKMLDMLSAQKQAFTFFCIKQGDNNIKLLH